jgi:hypothetical protein
VWISEDDEVDDVVDAADASENCWWTAKGGLGGDDEDGVSRAAAPRERLGLW